VTGWATRNGVRILVALVVLALLAAIMVQRSCSAARTATATAKLATGQAGAAIASGHDAADTIGNRMAGDAAGDTITRENDDAIRNARGADAPVDADATAAGLRGLCRRAAYRGDPQCVQYAGPR
jgi:type IV secretory pathway TrbL component